MGYTASRDFIVKPLTGCVAAEVQGDIRKIDQESFAGLRQAFLDHCVLVFREQYLGPDDLLEFTRWWGEIYITPYATKLEGYPAILRVLNVGKKNTITEAWHHDATFLPNPVAIGILSAHIVPETGGDTMFANQYRAYETLSEGLKRLLDGTRAFHKDTVLARAYGIDNSNMPPELHPVVRTHPDTLRKCLFVNPLFTFCFEDMTPEESKPVLEYLTAHAVNPEFVYRHRWQKGDVVMWDQRCTQHYAIHDHGDAVRELHRSTVGGTRPV